MGQEQAKNAAIWYVDDGYVTNRDNINGRRSAGQSFLRGFFKHADVDRYIAAIPSSTAKGHFIERADQAGRGIPASEIFAHDTVGLSKVGCLFYPSPVTGREAWVRHGIGDARYSLCGITHTTATRAVMDAGFGMRTLPLRSWDALICTSTSVQQSIRQQFDDIDAYLNTRFGGILPERPQIPVVPLGINTEDFEVTPAARAAARNAAGVGEDDVVFMTLSRLSVHEKFDPLPYFIALQQARDALGKDGPKLRVVLCGVFQDAYSRGIIKRGAKALMPDIEMMILDGSDPGDRGKAFALADVFAFPIDNIQETFGLAPIEGMAAGLPVLCSDWDGMKDTVTPAVGIRVPTLMAGEAALDREALRFLSGYDSYNQYVSQTSGVTVIDVPKLTEAILRFARSPELRKSMGQDALRRARDTYDWSAIIPQMQELWGELDARRAKANDHAPALRPTALSPGRLFASYPTEQMDARERRFVRRSGVTRAEVNRLIKIHNYDPMGRKPTSQANFGRVIEALTEDVPVTAKALSAMLKQGPDVIERALLWLMKFDLVREASEDAW
ncbi:MAG: glycosyltransferase family 4 protein [Pseudomonadota bacterium]